MLNLLERIGKSSNHKTCSNCNSQFKVTFLPLIFNSVRYSKVPFLHCEQCSRCEEVKGVMWFIQEYPHYIKDFSKFFKKQNVS